MFRSLIATVRNVTKTPKARGAFIRAMHVTTPALADILVANPKLMDHMLDALVAEAREDPSIVKRLLRERLDD